MMSQQSRGTPTNINVKQEPFNHVNPQMLFSQQQQQQQQQQRQQQQQQQPQPRQNQNQSSRPTPMMFMQQPQPNSSSALQHQYINDDSLAGSSTFADNELAESLGGYGNLGIDPFTYSNGFETSFDNDQNGVNSSNSLSGKSFPLRLPPQTNHQMYTASPSDFTSFSPEFGVGSHPAPIPFNRSRPGQMTSMSMPQFGGNNALQNHAAIMIGAGSLTASPSTPGFVGSFGAGGLSYPDIDGADAAKQAALKEKRQKRRESHNAVERRRRDNINEKIQELAAIIPDEFMTPASAIHGQSSPLGASPAMHHAPDGTIKHNKGIILRKSVDYIRSLQDVVKESQRRAKRLEEEVKRLGGDPKLVDQDESRRESITNLEDEESWLDEALIGDDSPGMMMD